MNEQEYRAPGEGASDLAAMVGRELRLGENVAEAQWDKCSLQMARRINGIWFGLRAAFLSSTIA